MKLNKNQLKAVRHKSGPLLVIAGAGTGKTTVITERIKYLISNKLAKPEEILALTFTEKASREMEARVDETMPLGINQIWISTFHSFCDRILREQALQIGLDPAFNLMNNAENIAFIKQSLFDFDLDYFRPRGNPNKFVEGLLQHFSRLQDEDISAIDYQKWAKGFNTDKEEKQKWLELANAYYQYEELKISKGVFDYGDLITKTLELFRKRPNVLKIYQTKFKYILVDEFQDTNYSQSQLVYLLASKHKNITVVGDDDQSIYRFRGAAISNILQFRKNFPKAKVVVLNQNYRSNQEILDKAYQLIQFNNPDRLEAVEGIDKKLISNSKVTNEQRIKLIHVERIDNETQQVAKIITDFVSKGKYQYSDFAILVRANSHADPFIKALDLNGIPQQFLGPGKLFKQKEVADLISYLKVLADTTDSLNTYKLFSIEDLQIPSSEVIKLSNLAREEGISLFETAAESDNETIKKLVANVNQNIANINKLTPGQILFSFLEEFNLLTKMLNPDSSDAEIKAKNIAKFFDKLNSFEAEHADITFQSVVDWIDLSMQLGEAPAATDTDWTQNNAVNILTVHSSKGLEFPIVFLVNLVSLRFPSISRSEQIPLPVEILKEKLPSWDFHLQEERRLFYVGMTRARDYLYLTAADYYGTQSGGTREKKLSQFIYESLGEGVSMDTQKTDSLEQLSLLDIPQKAITTKAEKNKFRIDYLSYSAYETFKICPLHYKLRYIVGISTPPSAAESLGISVHAALKSFYQLIKQGTKPSQKLLLECLGKNWISQGYRNKKYQQLSRRRAEEYLIGFFKNQFQANSIPMLLEQPFEVKLTAKDDKQLQLRIGGKMDRVDQLSKDRIEIIDYKTSEKVPTQAEVDKNEQLTFYALAASQMAKPFGQKPRDTVLSLYYFEDQVKLTTTRTQAQLDEFEAELFKTRHEIETSDFACSGSFWCQNCEFGSFCNLGVDRL